MCDHDNLVAIQGGWFCPDCGERFAARPLRPIKITFLNTTEKEEKKPATRKKKTEAKADS